MGNDVNASFKGTENVETKLDQVFNQEEAFQAFKEKLAKDEAAKAEFEAVLTNDGQDAADFWESTDPSAWLNNLSSEARQNIANGIERHLGN